MKKTIILFRYFIILKGNQLNRNWNRTVRFYSNRIKNKARKLNVQKELPEHLLPMVGNKKEVLIADVGSGPFPIIGDQHDTAKITIVASDYLADRYDDICKRHNIIPVIPVEKQDMECLTYEDGVFDIVHCVNALDHTSDAVQALKELERICKKGGWIYLRHYENVGYGHSYRGLHEWNIDRNGLMWNDCGVLYHLNELYDVMFKDSMVTCKKQKT